MNEVDAFPFRVELWDHDDQHVAEVLTLARNVAIARAAYQAALRERPGQIVRLRNRAHVVEEFHPQAANQASQATTFAIEATLRDRATKPKKFKLGDWAQVSGMVRACWPDEGKGDAGAAGRPTIHCQRGLDRETVETPGLLDRQAERMGV